MSGHGITVDPTVARDATKKFAPAATCAANSATHVEQLNEFQNFTKWGDEAGPLEFMDKYGANLLDVKNSLDDLHQKLLDFIKAMDDAVTTFVKTDDDSATKFTITKGQQNAGKPAPLPDGTNGHIDDTTPVKLPTLPGRGKPTMSAC